MIRVVCFIAAVIMAVKCQENCSVGYNPATSRLQFEMDLNLVSEGPPGRSGKRGEKGEPGLKGDTGARGYGGPKGTKGNTGAKGYRGYKGARGSSGPKGNEGEMEAGTLAALNRRIERLECEMKLQQRHWMRYGSYKFWISEERATWKQAKALCQMMQGRLAAYGMRSSSIRNHIRSKMSSSDKVWIGLDDNAREGSFVWSDGTRSTKSNTYWAGWEPNNSGDCGQLKSSGIDDDNCNEEKKFVCEFDSVCTG